MEQKNTIIKCAIPDCLFNHCGTCDQYAITIGVDKQCKAYTQCQIPLELRFTPDEIHHYVNFDETKNKTIILEGVSTDNSVEYVRGQRAKGELYEDGWVDPEIVKEVCKRCSDWDYAATPDICKTCKKVIFGQDCKWKDVAYGIWTCYEETDNLCLSCEHCNIHGKCGFTAKPMKDPNGKCCRFSKR